MAKHKRKIGPNYRASQWAALALDPSVPDTDDWRKAVAILDDRMRGRFFEPASALIAIDDKKEVKTFGFAILAIDCLVIETLQGFKDGAAEHHGKSTQLFTGFLKKWEFFTSCLPEGADAGRVALQIYSDLRCALLHSGQTDHDLTVGSTGPGFKFNGGKDVRINRTKFHMALVEAFDSYLARLLVREEVKLRKHFKKKMDAICGVPVAAR